VATYSTSALAVGSYSITASYGGDNSYVAATSTVLTLTVNKATPSITLTSSANPAGLGSSVTFTATLTGRGTTPSGAVTFVDGSTLLGTGTVNPRGMATLSISTLGAGPHSITASYGGDGNYLAATSAVLTETIQASQQTITFPAIPDTTLLTGSVTLTATASSGLPVSYKSATPTVCTVSGSKVTLLAVGNCGIVARQAGNSDYAAAAAVGRNFHVTLATQTITFPAVPDTTLLTGSVTLTATASSGLPVSYTSVTLSVCTVSGSKVTLLAVGNCGIVARQAGNSDYAVAAAVGRNFPVTLATQTITFPAIPATPLSAGSITLTATASSGLPVSYTSVTLSVCTVSGSKVTLLAVGNCGIVARQAGNFEYYAAAAVGRIFTVTAH
jgi:hypothetical protein